MQRIKNADKLAQFLASGDRMVLASSINCAVLFYDFYPPDVICFISQPSSIHARSLEPAKLSNLAFSSQDKLEQLQQLHNLAPISLGIYKESQICGLCAKARLITCTKSMKEQFFSRYKMARFALGHEVYALQILYAKYKNLTPYVKWEYKNFSSSLNNYNL